MVREQGLKEDRVRVGLLERKKEQREKRERKTERN